jgi:hypothetical protein
MVSLIAAVIGLFVLFAIGPFLGRAVVRLIHRVPALGAIATLGLFFLFADSSASQPLESIDTQDETSFFQSHFQSTTGPSMSWSPDHPHQVTTTDEDMPQIYRNERMRYAEEIESVKQAVKDFLVS